MNRATVFLLLAAGSGCAIRTPETYRLMERDHVRTLVPPGVASPDLAERAFAVRIAPGRARCPASGGVELRPRGNQVRVRVKRDELLRMPAAGLARWAGEAEARGCIAAGGAERLAARIVEGMPLDPSAAYRLLYSSDLRTGWVDLGPEIRLEVDSPIVHEGTSVGDALVGSSPGAAGGGQSIELEVRSSASLIGYERAWYAVRPKAQGLGFTIVPLAAERHIAGEVQKNDAPATNYLRFSGAAGFYRLFYKAERDTMRILVAAAATRAELETRTGEIERDPDACPELSGWCVAIPRGVAANPDVVVRVNGHEVAVPVRSNVRHAILQAGERNPGGIVRRLTVRRLWDGRPVAVEFDPASGAIFDLPLMGGEEIGW